MQPTRCGAFSSAARFGRKTTKAPAGAGASLFVLGLSSHVVLVRSFVVALGADRAERLVRTLGPDRELVATSGSSANRASRLVVHLFLSVGVPPSYLTV